jgi:hypothetical protein
MHEDKSSNESALEMRLKQITRYVTLGLLGVLALCALLFLYVGSVKQNEKAAISNTQVQADQTKDSDTCKIYPDQELCVLARKIAANPTEAVIPKDGKDGKDGSNGAKGDTGETGRGVTTFKISEDGNLIVDYTDGTQHNAGKVVGKDGIPGIDGKDGRGILSAGLDAGNLIIRYTDGKTENVGMVVGPAGAAGSDGAAGANGKDGLNGADGAPGAPGKDGISVTNLQVDSAGYVQVSYSNGTTQSAGRVIVNTITSMVCNSDTLTITMVDGTAFSARVDCTPDSSPVPPASSGSSTQTQSAPLVKIP